jgi:ATP-binding cassette subfamily F protein uup
VILIDAVDVTVTRPDRPLFVDVSVTVSTGDRLGVVGINGTGKSTLLRVIGGINPPESGKVVPGSGVRVSMLDQDAPLPAGTVLDAVTRVPGTEVWEAEEVLTRLGMGGHFDTDTSKLSGGEVKRVSLAKALVEPSDLLILDEPTNHLDIDGIEWLEQQLGSYRGGLILVSHDRHLLDRLTTRMLELDRGKAYVHEGGYASYLGAVDGRQSAAATAESIRANLAKRELAWLRRGAPARTSKPKARIATATVLVNERAEGQARPSELHLEFETPRLGDVIIEINDVSMNSPAGDYLFGPVTYLLDPRERLAVTGANGSGKTTLLNAMARKIEPPSGGIVWGSTVKLGYYQQNAEELDLTLRAREVVAGPDRQPDWTDAKLLEAFWFDKDSQWAPVGLLSGGERRRLQLLKVLASKPNVLLLDEPTNDLDLETLRALEDFLEDWPGAVVLVSHDRAFVNRVANRTLRIGPAPAGGTAVDKASAVKAGSKKAASKPAKPKPSTNTGRSSSTLGHLIRAAEKDLARLDRRKVNLNQQLAEAGSDHELLISVGAELAEVEAEMSQVEEAWLELSEERES